eukprot:TRINITY_DN6072_c0_g1_i1.p1 TRINITY_DN6072_c0_g1~~TRINITY_DN6072_c0_g1_i1.p1  ORF type:complete len:357 (-),score=41.26 TRINITY_DN6072_c0_g1_i1:1249-2319(-)
MHYFPSEKIESFEAFMPDNQRRAADQIFNVGQKLLRPFSDKYSAQGYRGWLENFDAQWPKCASLLTSDLARRYFQSLYAAIDAEVTLDAAEAERGKLLSQRRLPNERLHVPYMRVLAEIAGADRQYPDRKQVFCIHDQPIMQCRIALPNGYLLEWVSNPEYAFARAGIDSALVLYLAGLIGESKTVASWREPFGKRARSAQWLGEMLSGALVNFYYLKRLDSSHNDDIVVRLSRNIGPCVSWAEGIFPHAFLEHLITKGLLINPPAWPTIRYNGSAEHPADPDLAKLNQSLESKADRQPLGLNLLTLDGTIQYLAQLTAYVEKQTILPPPPRLLSQRSLVMVPSFAILSGVNAYKL